MNAITSKKDCIIEFKSNRILQDHICKIEVLEPTFGELYWIILTLMHAYLFRKFKNEVVFPQIAHTHKCKDNVIICPDMLPYFDNTMVNYNGNI